MMIGASPTAAKGGGTTTTDVEEVVTMAEDFGEAEEGEDPLVNIMMTMAIEVEGEMVVEIVTEMTTNLNEVVEVVEVMEGAETITTTTMTTAHKDRARGEDLAWDAGGEEEGRTAVGVAVVVDDPTKEEVEEDMITETMEVLAEVGGEE